MTAKQQKILDSIDKLIETAIDCGRHGKLFEDSVACRRRWLLMDLGVTFVDDTPFKDVEIVE